jgi:hypothetical protein
VNSLKVELHLIYKIKQPKKLQIGKIDNSQSDDLFEYCILLFMLRKIFQTQHYIYILTSTQSNTLPPKESEALLLLLRLHSLSELVKLSERGNESIY